MPRFAVVLFDARDQDDGEAVCFAACIARFNTETEAEAYRRRHFGQDDTRSMVIED